MKIGIDLSRAFIDDRTGTEEYAYQLFRQFVLMDSNKDEFVFYVKNGFTKEIALPGNCRFKKIKGNLLWTQLWLSLEILKNPIDVLFVPSHSLPLIRPKDSVVTIHGLEYRHSPGAYSLKERLLLEFNNFFSAKLSNRIIVPSESTKRDLIRFYGVRSSKIHVVYHGFEVGFVREKKQDKENFFDVLFVGRIETRKNIAGILKAFNIFMENIDASETGGFRLILAGRPGYGFAEIKKGIAASKYKSNILLTGYISSEQKKRFYSEAGVFLFPSLYEGFGLPVLEAMNFGLPVISSNNSSLPEITSPAALLVDPTNYTEIANAINRIYEDKDLRQKMITAGYENLKRFDWGKCAFETLNIIRK